MCSYVSLRLMCRRKGLFDGMTDARPTQHDGHSHFSLVCAVETEISKSKFKAQVLEIFRPVELTDGSW